MSLPRQTSAATPAVTPAGRGMRRRPATRPAAVQKWLVALSVLFGSFLAVMDVSVVNVAMPHMMGSFGETQSAITWVATSYSIAEIIMVTMAGWWSTLLGRKRLFLVSFVIFTAGSVLAGTAQTFAQILLYRTIQGLGGGSLIPLSQAIMRETFPPEEQGMAMAIYTMGVVIAPGLGQVVGGWLTDHYGWPAIFYINIPFSLMGILMVSIFVEDPPYLQRGVRHIDWFGIVLLTVGLTGMQIVLERGQQEDWFASRWITMASIMTAMVMGLLVVWELRAKEPVIHFRMLRNLHLCIGSGVGLIFGVALFGTTFILPQFTQNLLGYPALLAGLVLLPRSMTIFLVSPIIGRLYNYVDPRLLIMVGIGIIYVAYQQLAHLSLQVGFWNLVPVLMLLGLGMPCMFSTLATLALSTIKREQMTAASSLFTLARRVGGNLGYALVVTLVERRSMFHRVHLIPHISSLNSTYLTSHASLAAQIGRQQAADPASIQFKTLALINTMVNRQAKMLAYNDVSWFLAMMFLLVLPCIPFLRRKQGWQ
jgi:DHA2 family multidrug resistance protein